MRDTMTASERAEVHEAAMARLDRPRQVRQVVKVIAATVFVVAWVVSCNYIADNRIFDSEKQHQAYFEQTGQN